MSRQTARVTRPLLAIASLAAAGFSACSSQNSADPDAGATPSNSVLVKDAQHVIYKDDGGGFIVFPPPGAACSSDSYDFDLQAGSLAWNICRGTDPGNAASYSMVTGSRVLTSAERTQATAAARAVTTSDKTSCGADKPSLTLEVVAASGTTLYGDDFYACLMKYDHYVVSSTLDDLGVVLRGMAHNP